MHVRPDGAVELNFAELWSEIGGGTTFTSDRIIRMMAGCKERNEPFFMIHRDRRYIIPAEYINEYFTTHPTPEKPMKAEEEVRVLRAKIKELMGVIDSMRSGGVPKVVPAYVESVATFPEPQMKPDVPPGPTPMANILGDLKAELKANKVKPDVKNRFKDIPLL